MNEYMYFSSFTPLNKKSTKSQVGQLKKNQSFNLHPIILGGSFQTAAGNITATPISCPIGIVSTGTGGIQTLQAANIQAVQLTPSKNNVQSIPQSPVHTPNLPSEYTTFNIFSLILL